MFFLAATRKLGVNYGQSLETGPWWIIGIVGRFTIIFAPKFVTFFSLLHQNAVDIQKWPLRGYSYPSSTIWFSRISGDIEIDDVTCGTKSTTIHDVLQWATEVLRHLVVKFDFGASWSHFSFFPQNNVILISFSTAQTSAPSQPWVGGRGSQKINARCK